ncbi:hypothetical protein [Streptomyces purpureus]|uniref:hypothetical protein n=1 Tax=Streptomyces purpureus TaxID=1951 RepID=UPI00036AF512|nr:hypothetical protein [Streptomyces purpureus]
MKYRDTSTRVPLDEKREAQKSVVRDSALQENPVRVEIYDVHEADGHRPGAAHSAYTLTEDMQRHDGYRPAGSFSPSSRNIGGRQTGRWTRRMVVDDGDEREHFEEGVDAGREDVVETYTHNGGARFTVRYRT